MTKSEDNGIWWFAGICCLLFVFIIYFSSKPIVADQVFGGTFHGALYNMGGFFIFTDSKNDTHVLQADGTQHDRLRKGIILSPVDLSYFSNTSGIYVNISSSDDATIKININGTQKNTRVTEFIKKLNNGTENIPVANYVYLHNFSNPTIDIKSSSSEVDALDDHVWITKALVGNFTGSNYNIYTTADSDDAVELALHNTEDRLYRQGLLYADGFAQTVNTTNIEIATGEYWYIAKGKETTTNLSFNIDGVFYINASGGYMLIDSLDEITTYSDTGALIGNSKYYNLVWGIVSSDGIVRLMVLIQGEPSTEYNSVGRALADPEDKLVNVPNIDLLRLNFLPIARTVVQRGSGVFSIVSGSEYFLDLRGSIGGAGGSAPSPSITNHNELNNLAWSVAGHTFDSDLNINNNELVAGLGQFSNTSTGGNAGTDICIDVNNRLCKCGSCA